MKRQFIHSLCFLCVVLLTVVFTSASVFAAPNCSSPQKMLKSASDPSWNKGACVHQFSKYIRSLDAGTHDAVASNKQNITVLKAVSSQLKDNITHLRRTEGQSEKWEYWYKIYNEFARSFGERPEKLVWNGHDYVLSEQIERQVTRQLGPEVLPGWPKSKVWEDASKANKRVTNLQGLLDLMIKRVQAGADLGPFIELIVNDGKANKNDPHYVSDDVISTAFLLYAYSVPANRADKILKYTNKKYAPRVRFAAASAVAEFAQNSKTRNGLVPNEPSGRLALTDKQREQVLDIFGVVFDNAKTDLTRAVVQYRLKRVYGDVNWMANNERPVAQHRNQAAIGPITLVLTPSLAQMLAAEASAYASSIGASIASGTTALQAALAAPATALTGEVFIGAVPVVIFGMALDDAFAPTYKAAFEHKLREALGVETFPAYETQSNAFTQVYDGRYALTTLTSTKADEATQTAVRQTAPCIHQHMSMTADCPSFRNIPHTGNFSSLPNKSSFMTGGISRTHWEQTVKNKNNPKNGAEIYAKELAQLEQIWQQRCSFWVQVPTGSGPQKAKGFVRAVYYNGEWVPNVEVSMDTGLALNKENMPNKNKNTQLYEIGAKKPLGQLMAFLRSWTGNDLTASRELTGVIRGIMMRQNFNQQGIGGGFSVRHGIHTIKEEPAPYDHFHLERMCVYNPVSVTPNPCHFGAGMPAGNIPSSNMHKYQCNVSLLYR